MTKDPEKIKAQRRKYYLANKKKAATQSLQWHRDNREHVMAMRRANRIKLREKVLDKFGNRCARCPETTPVVLQVDHVNNNGKENDIKFQNRSSPAYLKHVLADTTDAYQLLCANCNLKKYFLLAQNGVTNPTLRGSNKA